MTLLSRTIKTSSPTTKPFKEASDIPLEVRVEEEKPTNLTVSASNAHAIADNLTANIANLPIDDLVLMEQPEVVGCIMRPEHAQPTGVFPKVIDNLPTSDFLENVKWQQIKNLPGYVISGIRKMGRDTFESFDCFSEYSKQKRSEGVDPLSEVMVMTEFTHDKLTVNYFAEMIVKNGVKIEKGQMDYGRLMPGYKPDIMVLMTPNFTYKLVRDRIENGAPVNLNSIYAWPGGLSHYRQQVESRCDLKLGI